MPKESPEFLALSWRARGLMRLLVGFWDSDGKRTIRGGMTVAEAVGVLLRAPSYEVNVEMEEMIERGIFRISTEGDQTTIFNTMYDEEIQWLKATLVESGKANFDKSDHIVVSRVGKKEKKETTMRRGRPPADIRHRPMIDLFCRLWSELRGGAYDVSAKDGMQVSRFLRAHPTDPLEEIERRMRLAFSDPWFSQNGSLALFCSRWSNYDRVVPGGKITPLNSPDKLRRIVGFDPETRKPIYV